MRLIDELLKDDFFHGGYHPPVPVAQGKAVQGSSGNSGKKPIILIAAAVGGFALLGAGGFFFYTSGQKTVPAAQTAGAKAPAATAQAAAKPVATTPTTTAAAPVELVVAEAPVTPAALAPDPVAAIEAPVAAMATPPPVAETPAKSVPAPAPVAPAPVAVAPVKAVPPPAVVAAVAPPPPAPVAVAKPVEPDLFTLVFPKFSDKGKAEAVVAKLKEAGANPKLVTGSDKVTAYRVKSAKNATAAESNAIKLKASIFKVSTTPSPQADGTVVFDFGVFPTKAEAEAVVGNAKKLSHEVAISEEKTSVPVYSIDAGKWPEVEARATLSSLAGDGEGVKVKKVK